MPPVSPPSAHPFTPGSLNLGRKQQTPTEWDDAQMQGSRLEAALVAQQTDGRCTPTPAQGAGAAQEECRCTLLSPVGPQAHPGGLDALSGALIVQSGSPTQLGREERREWVFLDTPSRVLPGSQSSSTGGWESDLPHGSCSAVATRVHTGARPAVPRLDTADPCRVSRCRQGGRLWSSEPCGHRTSQCHCRVLRMEVRAASLQFLN